MSLLYLGLVLGFCLGYIVAALMSASHEADVLSSSVMGGSSEPPSFSSSADREPYRGIYEKEKPPLI